MIKTKVIGGIRYHADCPIRFNGLPVSDERCGQFG